ncbi:hypothetical protein GF337_20230, partial [candidate division KSB1 bacterium]|nr:hypothetical protein [candidate division KSB1 bacterium]
MKNKILNLSIFIFILPFFFGNAAIAQELEFKIHDRGMLHETVYNTGDIGRPWTTGEEGNKTNTPLMEWPSRSATIVQGTR